MSGLVGIWNLNGDPLELDVLRALLAPISHRGPDGLFWWHEGSLAVGCAQMKVTPEARSEVMPHVGHRGDVLVWDGRLDNRRELIHALRDRADLRADSPDAALVMAAYERWGDRSMGRLEGDFALAVVDRSRHALLLGRDAIGARPLFWYRSPRHVIFASEVKAILAHPAVHFSANRDLLARVLLPTAPFAGEESATFFDGISAVRAAHLVEFTPERTRVRRYWDFDLTRTERHADLRGYADAFRDHLTTAVDRRLRASSPPAISLSGGLDSSAIYCLVEKRRTDPPWLPSLAAFTYEATPGGPADELRYVHEIEQRYGVTVERVPIQPAGTLAGARDVVLNGEGPLPAGIAEAGFRLLGRARALGSRVILTGLFADQVLTDETYVADLVNDLALVTAFRHVRGFTRWNTDAAPGSYPRAFRSAFVRAHVPQTFMPLTRRVRARIRPPRRPWFDPGFVHKSQTVDPQRVSRRQTSASHQARNLYDDLQSYLWRATFDRVNNAAARFQLEMANPFLDRDLLSFVMAIPGAVINHEGVPKAIMREALRDALPDPIAQRRWKADFSLEIAEGLLRGWAEIEDVLRDAGGITEHGISTPERIAPHLVRWRRALAEGDPIAARRLQELLALELWFRSFAQAV